MRTSAQQRVYDAVKRDLLEGVIRPGERIFDAELCARLQVSRTPVREALLALEREGLIRIVPRQGYFASEISLREALDAYQLRVLLEPIATAMAAKRITPTELERLRELADVALDGSDEGFACAVEANEAFHVQIAQASGNKRLARIMAGLMADLKRLAYVELRTARAAVSWRDEHHDIIDALARHDTRRAAQVVRESFKRDDGLLPLRAHAELAQIVEEVEQDTEHTAARQRR